MGGNDNPTGLKSRAKVNAKFFALFLMMAERPRPPVRVAVVVNLNPSSAVTLFF